jgi:hypothetical protein
MAFHVAEFLELRDHGKHHAHFAEGRRAQDRAELRAEDLRAVEAHAHAALAEEGIVLLRNRQVGERLVAADIERANDERLVAPTPARWLCKSRTARPRRRVVRSMKRNSERSRPTPSPPRSAICVASFKPPMFADDFDARAVERDGGFVRVREVFLAPLLGALLRVADAGDFLRRGMQAQRAFAAIEDHGVPFGNFERGGFDAASAGRPANARGWRRAKWRRHAWCRNP